MDSIRKLTSTRAFAENKSALKGIIEKYSAICESMPRGVRVESDEWRNLNTAVGLFREYYGENGLGE